MKTEDGRVYTRDGKRMKHSFDMYVKGLFDLSIVVYEHINLAARSFKETHGIPTSGAIPSEESHGLVTSVFAQKTSYFIPGAPDSTEKACVVFAEEGKPPSPEDIEKDRTLNFVEERSVEVGKLVIRKFGLYTACESWLFAQSYFVHKDAEVQATGGRESIPIIWRALDLYFSTRYKSTLEKAQAAYEASHPGVPVPNLNLPASAEGVELPKTADIQANKDAAEARRFGPPSLVIPKTEEEADAILAKGEGDGNVRGPTA
jgi:hypothetical protein